MKNVTEKRTEGKLADVSRALLLGAFIEQELRAFVLTAGMAALDELLERERTELCGPRYRHQSEREAYRGGHAPGELVLGGRKVTVKRPRVRSRIEGELGLPSWAAFSEQDPLSERVMEQMMVGVSTRRYERSLEDVPPTVTTRGTSKSAVSRPKQWSHSGSHAGSTTWTSSCSCSTA